MSRSLFDLPAADAPFFTILVIRQRETDFPAHMWSPWNIRLHVELALQRRLQELCTEDLLDYPAVILSCDVDRTEKRAEYDLDLHDMVVIEEVFNDGVDASKWVAKHLPPSVSILNISHGGIIAARMSMVLRTAAFNVTDITEEEMTKDWFLDWLSSIEDEMRQRDDVPRYGDRR